MTVSKLILEKIKERKEHFYKELGKESNKEGWYWLQGALCGVDDCLYFIEKIMGENNEFIKKEGV